MSAITIVKGSTYRDVLRWASSACVFKACTIQATAPLRLTCTAHGIPDGWYVFVEGSKDIPETTQYPVKVIDANTLEISCLNGTKFKTGSAVVRFNEPVDLSGYTARMQIKDKVGGSVLLSPTITLDNTAKTITREIDATTTAAITWKKGVFDLEMVNGTFVIKIDSGTVAVQNEVTT